jgi:Na+-driven multidrug efflux pump
MMTVAVVVVVVVQAVVVIMVVVLRNKGKNKFKMYTSILNVYTSVVPVTTLCTHFK